ncbi:MAG: S41 family peptidase [Bacteroidota bacterium]
MKRTNFIRQGAVTDTNSPIRSIVFAMLKEDSIDYRSSSWKDQYYRKNVPLLYFLISKIIYDIFFRLILAILLVFLPVLVDAQGSIQNINREEALEDIQFLKKNLERSHPGMHRFTSKEEMDKAYAKTSNELTDMSLFKFYGEVSKLLSLIRCGHTQPELPNRVLDFYLDDLMRIPFDVSFLDGKMVVSKDHSTDNKLERGSLIISIDGLKTEDILSEFFERINGDGFVESFKYEYLELFFWILYPQYFIESGLPQSYTVEYKRPFEETVRKVVVEGISPASIAEKKDRQEKEMRSLKLEDDYALLTIKTFTGGKSDKYYSFLKKSFKKINGSGIKNLIIDLRDNGGGADDYGIELVTYLADSDFNYFDRIEVTEHYAGQSDRVKSENGRHYWPDHPGLAKWSPNEDRFQGNVYVLTNGISFSTTADVASVLYDNQWATFIGQETGGGAYGNTSGHSTTIRLPNSKITVDLPYWKYFTALQKEYPQGRGVIPDYIIIPTLKQFIDGVDVEMDKAISLIRSNK